MDTDVGLVFKIKKLAGGADSFGWGIEFMAKATFGVCG